MCLCVLHLIGKEQHQQERRQKQLLQKKKPQEGVQQPGSSSPTAITSSDATGSRHSSVTETEGANSEVEDEEEDGGGGCEEEDEQEDTVEEEDDVTDDEEDSEANQVKDQPCVEFSVGELVWGAARGHPSLPGKVVPAPNGGGGAESSPHGKRSSVLVRWFGGRPVIELVPMELLKSLSEGLDAHHRAQKDTRK